VFLIKRLLPGGHGLDGDAALGLGARGVAEVGNARQKRLGALALVHVPPHGEGHLVERGLAMPFPPAHAAHQVALHAVRVAQFQLAFGQGEGGFGNLPVAALSKRSGLGVVPAGGPAVFPGRGDAPEAFLGGGKGDLVASAQGGLTILEGELRGEEGAGERSHEHAAQSTGRGREDARIDKGARDSAMVRGGNAV
jgi:hypothetical protein